MSGAYAPIFLTEMWFVGVDRNDFLDFDSYDFLSMDSNDFMDSYDFKDGDRLDSVVN